MNKRQDTSKSINDSYDHEFENSMTEALKKRVETKDFIPQNFRQEKQLYNEPNGYINDDIKMFDSNIPLKIK